MTKANQFPLMFSPIVRLYRRKKKYNFPIKEDRTIWVRFHKHLNHNAL